MARHMICVKISPEAPTSDPAIISTLLSSTKPVAAAARPEHELSKAITTGISAPPMGNTSNRPNSEATPTIAQKASGSPSTSQAPKPALPRASTPVAKLLAGKPDQALEHFHQLEEGHDTTPESHRADDPRGSRRSRELVGRSLRLNQRCASHQRGGTAAQAVKNRHQLGHGGQGNFYREDHANQRTHYCAEQNVFAGENPLIQQGDDDGQQHPQGTQQVAAHGRTRVRQPP